MNNLEYEPYIDKLWLMWDKLHSDMSYSESMDAFYNAMLNHKSRNDHYYPDDFASGEHFSGYTYNEENILSQDFVYFVMGDYVFIQTHNGCDARGGFSTPRLFSCNVYDSNLLCFGDYTISCDNGHYHDFTSGGYYEETEQEIELNGCDFVEYDTEQEIKALCSSCTRFTG